LRLPQTLAAAAIAGIPSSNATAATPAATVFAAAAVLAMAVTAAVAVLRRDRGV
jgi:hypothetical protein